MRRILVHPLASVLSAFGIGVADRLAVRRASLQLQLTEDALVSAHTRLAELEGADDRKACAYIGLKQEEGVVFAGEVFEFFVILIGGGTSYFITGYDGDALLEQAVVAGCYFAVGGDVCEDGVAQVAGSDALYPFGEFHGLALFQ